MARAKNTNLKRANQETEYTHEQVLELKKCAEDPVYFIKKYIKIQHPVRGSIPFELYPYQEEMIRAFHEHRYTVVLASRQVGKSQVSGAFLLWYAIFNFEKTVLIASNKNSNAMEMINRVKFAYENLPAWIKPGVKDDMWNKHQIGFDNGSRIISEATSENSGRGFSISCLYLDEFAFVPPDVQKEFWTSISPTLSTGGQAIITSTPNGDVNIFAELWRGSQVNSNGFVPIRVEWDQPPGRDEKFKEHMIGQIGERMWTQEYECEFLSADALLIDSVVLQTLTAEVKKFKVLGKLNEVEFWSAPVPGKTYVVGVDPATGTGEDFSVVSVFSFPELVQVAQYRSNTMSTNELYKVMKNILQFYVKRGCEVYFSVEKNGVGEGVISLFEADDDPPLAEFVSEEGADKRGMTTTSRTKMKACINLKEMITRRSMTIRSPILLAELKQFIRRRGSYAAQAGSTDDCISAVLIITRIIEEMASFDQDAFEKLYSFDPTEAEWDESALSSDDSPMPVVV